MSSGRGRQRRRLEWRRVGGCECANGIESHPFDDNSNESELSHRLDAAWGRAESSSPRRRSLCAIRSTLPMRRPYLSPHCPFDPLRSTAPSLPLRCEPAGASRRKRRNGTDWERIGIGRRLGERQPQRHDAMHTRTPRWCTHHATATRTPVGDRRLESSSRAVATGNGKERRGKSTGPSEWLAVQGVLRSHAASRVAHLAVSAVRVALLPCMSASARRSDSGCGEAE